MGKVMGLASQLGGTAEGRMISNCKKIVDIKTK
jgi:hypothetical protein